MIKAKRPFFVCFVFGISLTKLSHLNFTSFNAFRPIFHVLLSLDLKWHSLQIYSLIEESGKKGIWIRDIRDRTGLSQTQMRKVLKVLEQRKLVKSIKVSFHPFDSEFLYMSEDLLFSYRFLVKFDLLFSGTFFK